MIQDTRAAIFIYRWGENSKVEYTENGLRLPRLD